MSGFGTDARLLPVREDRLQPPRGPLSPGMLRRHGSQFANLVNSWKGTLLHTVLYKGLQRAVIQSQRSTQ